MQWLGLGRIEEFCSPMNISQPFDKPMPLHCELQKCFSVFSSLLGGT